MARLLFPLNRAVFLYTASGEPIRQPWESEITIYEDEELTTLASILDPDNQALPGSIIFIGDDGLLPDFYGPNNAPVVWAKPVEGDAYPLVAKMGEYVAWVLSTFEPTPIPGTVVTVEYDEIDGWPARPDVPEGYVVMWVNRYDDTEPDGDYIPFVDIALIDPEV